MAQRVVGARIQTIFVQPDLATANAEFRQVVVTFEGRSPKVAQTLASVKVDIVAYMESSMNTADRLT